MKTCAHSAISLITFLCCSLFVALLSSDWTTWSEFDVILIPVLFSNFWCCFSSFIRSQSLLLVVLADAPASRELSVSICQRLFNSFRYDQLNCMEPLPWEPLMEKKSVTLMHYVSQPFANNPGLLRRGCLCIHTADACVCVSLGTIKYSSDANVIRPSLDARERSALRVSPDLMLLLPVCSYESEFWCKGSNFLFFFLPFF